MPNAALRAAIGQREPSTRYIYDRCNGSSVYRDEARRPCCYICYVPPPVYAFSDTCEQNGLCECIGRIGCCGQKSQKMRSGIFTVVLLLNFYALALSVFANLAASDAITLLERSNFAQGVVYFQTNQAIVTVRAYMGLEYVAIRDVAGILGTRNYHNNNSSSSLSTMAAAATTNSNGESIYTWDDFCGNFTTTTTSNNNADANDVVPSSIIEPFVDLAACQECAETSGNIQRLFAFCNLALIILIATNVLRRFPNYDVNCQKAWALLASSSAAVCCGWAWYSYDRDCFDVLFRPDDDLAVPNTANTNTIRAAAPMAWEAGSALICTFCAAAAAAFMFLCHLVVPTPSICYEAEEQNEYEEQHRAIRNVQLPQIIPEVEEKEEEYDDDNDDDDGIDDSSVYYDKDEPKASKQPRVVVNETLAL